jgi:hypothetical protein
LITLCVFYFESFIGAVLAAPWRNRIFLGLWRSTWRLPREAQLLHDVAPARFCEALLKLPPARAHEFFGMLRFWDSHSVASKWVMAPRKDSGDIKSKSDTHLHMKVNRRVQAHMMLRNNSPKSPAPSAPHGTAAECFTQLLVPSLLRCRRCSGKPGHLRYSSFVSLQSPLVQEYEDDE